MIGIRRIVQDLGECRDMRGIQANQADALHMLATLYRHLGIDPAATIPDRSNRPME